MIHPLTAKQVSDLETPLCTACMSLSAIVQMLSDAVDAPNHLKNHDMAMLLERAVLEPLREIETALFPR